MVCRFLCEEATESLTEKQFVPAVRKFFIKHLLTGFLKTFLFTLFHKNVIYLFLYVCIIQEG